MNAIDVRGLHKQFGAQRVLAAVDLDVPRGQLLGLVGPNGAGKSTLLRILIGLVPYDAGQVAVLGRDPRRHAIAIRQLSCYLPGETGVYAQMTGAEFLRFAAGFYPRQDAALRTELGSTFELPLHQRVRSYSAGMKQKLALLATLTADVDLYLLDEPDRALDASVRFRLREVLLRLKDAGKTIVLSSHHLSELETLADRLEFLFGGRFVPPPVLAAARARLQRRLRVRWTATGSLPAGARLLATEPDGTQVIETEHPPLQWLQQLPVDSVQSAELGIARLEDLYQLLQQDAATAGGAR